MNNSYSSIPMVNVQVSPVVEQLGQELTKAFAYLLIPTELMYFSIYFHIKGHRKVYEILTFLSIGAFWLSPIVAPITCGPARCLQNFAIAIGTMKLLDIWARKDNLPIYTASARPPPDWLFPLIFITELRYESFTPNHIRAPKYQENFSEPFELLVHISAFAVLQSLPQNLPTVLAFEVLLAIYIIWTSIQLLVRYKTSPALFGPLYLIDSLTGFWSETWHNAFASPCTSLAYAPLRDGLPKFGVPVVAARSLGVLGAFSLMAVFHIYALYPILNQEALFRIGVFFFLNGIGTVAEAAIWGRKNHWIKTTLAWIFETSLATWTASGINIPNGLSRIPWGTLCDVVKY